MERRNAEMRANKWRGINRGNVNVIVRRISSGNINKRTELMWKLPYLKCAGVYFPEYASKLEEFKGLEPAPLYFSRNGKQLDMSRGRNRVDITWVVADPVVVNSRKMQLGVYRKKLNRGDLEEEMVMNEVERLDRVGECGREGR